MGGMGSGERRIICLVGQPRQIKGRLLYARALREWLAERDVLTRTQKRGATRRRS
jgi:hypothetical protein